MIHHLNYNIDKKKYRDLFYDNIQMGQWHWSVPRTQNLYWYQLFVKGNSPLKPLLRDVERDLNIEGLDNFPRFSYQFPNTRLSEHVDEDKIIGININLMEKNPTIHIEGRPYEYSCAVINVGKYKHSVEIDPMPRLILKFCLRHSWEEVIGRLEKVGLIC